MSPEFTNPEDLAQYLADTSPVSGNRWEDLVEFYDLPRLRYTKILDICAGESNFVPWLRRKGAQAFALDLGYSNPEKLHEKRKDDLIQYSIHEGIDASTLDRDKLATDAQTRDFQRSFQEHPDYYVAGSAHSLPFRNSSFDFVTSFYGIFGVLDKDSGLLSLAVEEAIRIMKPGGQIQIGPAIVTEYGLSSGQVRNQTQLIESLKERSDLTVTTPVSFYRGNATGLLRIIKNRI